MNMYEGYLNISNVPSGAILYRILKKEKMSQIQLAHCTGIPAQKINDLIAGRRRFTPKIALQIGDQLPIENKGFFYIIQCNHDIYIAQREADHKPLPEGFRQALFWDVNFADLDLNRNKNFIIQRVFEYGTDNEIRLTISLYGKDEISSILSKIESTWKKDVREKIVKQYLT